MPPSSAWPSVAWAAKTTRVRRSTYICRYASVNLKGVSGVVAEKNTRVFYCNKLSYSFGMDPGSILYAFLGGNSGQTFILKQHLAVGLLLLVKAAHCQGSTLCEQKPLTSSHHFTSPIETAPRIYGLDALRDLAGVPAGGRSQLGRSTEVLGDHHGHDGSWDQPDTETHLRHLP